MAKTADNVLVQIHAHSAGEPQGFIVGENGCLEGIPGKDKSGCARVQLGTGAPVRELLQAPTFHFTSGGVERVFW